MTTPWTIVAPLVTRDGANVQSYFSNDPKDFWSPIKNKIWAIPSLEVRSLQAPVIPVRLGHGRPPAGRITRLERRASDGMLWCVGELDGDVAPLPDHDYFLSVESTFDKGTIGRDIEITGAALVDRSAMSGLSPVTFIRNGLDQNGKAVWRLGDYQQALLERSNQTKYRTRASEPTVVYDEPGTATPRHGSVLDYDQPAGPLEYRSATPLGVHGRTIQLLAMPYEEEALVEHQGRMVMEICTRGAFAGSERRAARVKVNRDHDITRVVGRVTRLDTTDPAGLLADVRIAKTLLGDETLALVEDDVLDVSAGFLPLPGGEKWETRTRRRLTKCWLGHLALVPEPAYEGARVLGVV